MWCLYTMMSLSSSCSIISVLFTQDYLLSSLRLIENIDTDLRKYGVEPDYYRECNIIHTVQAVQVVAGTFNDIVLCYQRPERTIKEHLGEAFCYTPFMAIHTYFIVFTALICDILTKKLKAINAVCMKIASSYGTLDADDIPQTGTCEIEDIDRLYHNLKDITVLHGKVCLAAKHFNAAIQAALLSQIILGMFVIIISIVYMINNEVGSLSSQELAVHILVFNFQLIYLLKRIEFVNTEVSV